MLWATVGERPMKTLNKKRTGRDRALEARTGMTVVTICPPMRVRPARCDVLCDSLIVARMLHEIALNNLPLTGCSSYRSVTEVLLA
jgi:hypothetical protein